MSQIESQDESQDLINNGPIVVQNGEKRVCPVCAAGPDSDLHLDFDPKSVIIADCVSCLSNYMTKMYMDKKTIYRGPFLFLAIENNSLECLDSLLASAEISDLKFKGEIDINILTFIIKYGSLGALHKVLNKIQTLNQDLEQDFSENDFLYLTLSPLHTACIYKKPDFIKALIAFKDGNFFNVERQTGSGDSVLHLAIRADSVEVIEALNLDRELFLKLLHKCNKSGTKPLDQIKNDEVKNYVSNLSLESNLKLEPTR